MALYRCIVLHWREIQLISPTEIRSRVPHLRVSSCGAMSEASRVLHSRISITWKKCLKDDPHGWQSNPSAQTSMRKIQLTSTMVISRTRTWYLKGLVLYVQGVGIKEPLRRLPRKIFSKNALHQSWNNSRDELFATGISSSRGVSQSASRRGRNRER